jgi:hypothetical protein
MSTDINLFQPDAGSTVTLAATTTSASVSIPLTAPSMYVYNAGTSTVYVRWGKGAQTASATTDMPIPSNAIQTFGKQGADTFAAVCATGTATVSISPGEGS